MQGKEIVKISVMFRQSGFTIVELVSTIVLLGFGLAMFSKILVFALSESATPFDDIRTTALGQAYLDEILSRRFDENSHPSGTPTCYTLVGGSACSAPASFGANMDPGENNRSKFDDVDDYHNLDEGEGAVDTTLSDADDTDRTGYDGYRVTVTVEYAGNDPPINKGQTDAKLITVTVLAPTNSTGTQFTAYKANF